MFDSKKKKLERIIDPKSGRTLILAFDHGVEHGPSAYEGVSLNPERIARIAVKGKVNGIVVHVGVGRLIKKLIGKIPLIIKLTGRTNLCQNEIQEVVTSVEEAKKIGANAIAFTLYVGSDYEYRMLKRLAEVKLECMKYNLPLLGFAYPRSKKLDRYDVDAVRYAARVGAEVGFDVVKTYYTGSKESFSKVVKDAGFVPIVAAGGPKLEETEVIPTIKNIVEAGAAGVAIGRNVWMRDDDTAIRLLLEIRDVLRS